MATGKRPNKIKEYMYIIARYNEDITWTKDLDEPYFIVQKGEHMEQKGREPASYFWYIKENYDNLKGIYRFRQGHPQDHPVGEFKLQCDWNGEPHHPGLKIKKHANELGIEIPPRLDFTPGAQFDITAEQIKKRPKEWYEKAFEISLKDEEMVGYSLERLWKYIFDII